MTTLKSCVTKLPNLFLPPDCQCSELLLLLFQNLLHNLCGGLDNETVFDAVHTLFHICQTVTRANLNFLNEDLSRLSSA